MHREIKKLVIDIKTAIEEIETFTKDKNFADLQKERGLQLIVERELEIIGEALNRLRRVDPEIDTKVPDTRRIIGLRNIIAHGYDILEYEILWDIVENKILLLKEDLSKVYKI